MAHIGYFPVREYPRPLSIGPPAFVPKEETYSWRISEGGLQNRTSIDAQNFYAPVFLPHGATVTRLKLYGYRLAAGGNLNLYLERITLAGNIETLATLVADWTGGDGSIETTTIEYAKIDNVAYYYIFAVFLNPEATAGDVQFERAIIDWH